MIQKTTRKPIFFKNIVSATGANTRKILAKIYPFFEKYSLSKSFLIYNAKSSRGFTLIELVVSLAIVTIITSTVIFKYADFTDKTALSKATNDLALAIRQAQVYGINVNQTAVSSGDFTRAFGIYVNPACNPQTYYIFVDGNANQRYDFQNGNAGCGTPELPTNGDVFVEKASLTNGIVFSDVCNGSGVCFSNNPGIVRRMSITFLRPNTDARIKMVDNNGNNWGALQTTGQIVFLSPRGATAVIVIGSTGQISIQ